MADQLPLPALHHHQQHGCCFRRNQLILDLYLDQVPNGGSKNQSVVLRPNAPSNFGMLAVNDWALYDGDQHDRKLVAHARGHHMQTSQHDVNHQWFISCQIVFADDSRHKGSTLVVIGTLVDGQKGDWAIVGGTGEFTLAQGVIYHDIVRNHASRRFRLLQIRAQYITMGSPVTFIEFNAWEIDDALRNSHMVGEGGYGKVYKAVPEDRTVAIKVHKRESLQGEREFNQEVDILERIRHPNLVTLVGACREKFALVYEFLPDSLENLITGAGEEPDESEMVVGRHCFHGGSGRRRRKQQQPEKFPWEKRVEVAASVCSALVFLHNHRSDPIAHGDLKPSNVLFDKNGVCKLSDFGISRRLQVTDDTETPHHVTEQPMGSQSYIDPQFVMTHTLTPHSDAYALGIILLQLVTGKKDALRLRRWVLANANCKLSRRGGKTRRQQEGGEDVRWSRDMESELRWKSMERMVDKKLKLVSNRSKRDAMKMVSLGLECSNYERRDRPSLESVVLPSIESMKRSDANHHQLQEKQPPSRFLGCFVRCTPEHF